MLTRHAEDDILPYCLKHNIATLTYMSLEQGLLTGKIGMDRVFSKDEFRSDLAGTLVRAGEPSTFWTCW